MENRKSITYSFEDIKRYRQGMMSREEMHAFEKASMEDPFLSDALEGYMEADMALADEHLENIKERITGKEEKKEQAVVVTMPKKGFAMWRVAAMVIVIAGAGLITYKVLNRKDVDTNGPIAVVPKESKVPVTTPENATPSIDTNNNEVNIGKEETASTAIKEQHSKATKKHIILAGREKVNAKEEKNIQAQTKMDNIGSLQEVVVTPAAPKTADAASKMSVAEFRGSIVTPSNEPLANASLRLDNSRKEIRTDENGNFSLNTKDTVVNATITSGDYANTRMQLRSNVNNIINLGTIRMAKDEALEKTIVVINLHSKKIDNNETATNKPVVSWEQFRAYISQELGISLNDSSYKSSNSAELEFVVDKYGKPKHIIVLNTTDVIKSKHLVNAIKNGPKWTATNQKARILIKF